MKALMRAMDMIVFKVFCKDAAEMIFTEDNHVIQALSANRADHSLRSKRGGPRREEITCCNIFGMVGQQRSSGLRGRLWSSYHVFADGRNAHVEAEQAEFTGNPRRAPGCVLTRHASNQVPNSRATFGLPGLAQVDFQRQ